MIAVLAPTGPYRAAVAELPLSARLADRAEGAVVVVPGAHGWAEAARAAQQAGALAVVVVDPVLTPAATIGDLAARAGIPVIVDRPLFRPDAAADARASRSDGAGWTPPRTIVLDAAATAERTGVVARDAIGWGRVLAGGPVSIVAADRGLALGESIDGIPVTLSVAATRRPGRGWIRAHALGEVITEVDVEGPETRVTTATAAGRLILPRRFESSERAALRRAIAAVDSGDPVEDLLELAADTETAERIGLPGA